MNRIAFHKTGLAVVAGGLMLLASCTSDPNSPGVEFMPDMYRSLSHETYGQYTVVTTDSNGVETEVVGNTARLPVEGTIPRGWYTPFPYADNAADRLAAGEELKSPFTTEEKMAYLAEGKKAYDKWCTHCHGATGAGDGQVVKSGHPNPQPYDSETLKNLSEGTIYTTIMLGKGMMGSHASQIEEPDRWKIVAYVQTLQGKSLEGADAEEAPAEGDTDTADAEDAGTETAALH